MTTSQYGTGRDGVKILSYRQHSTSLSVTTAGVFREKDSTLLENEQKDSSSMGSSVSSPLNGPMRKGLSMWLAAIFIAGEMAGSGLLALSHALAQSGWAGVAMIFVCCLSALYSGICLGHCWLILEERWEEYKGKSRNPYPTIASRAVAPWMRYVVSFCVDFTLFGVATVFLLLSAQIIGNLAHHAGIASCHWILILAAVLCPLMWLGTPEDFWPAAVIALITTVSASLLLITAIIKDKVNVPKGNYENPSLESFSLSFATILFAFGGASTFPTFQNDMRDRSKFPKSASLAFVVLILLYVPVAICGYFVYGHEVKDSVIDSITDAQQCLKIAVEVLLAIHLFFAFLLAINAPAQEAEEFFNIPKKFSWKRCVLRSTMMLLIVFVAMSIPRFGKILNLVGGSTITFMTFVFPPLFYMLLVRQKREDWPERNISLPSKIYLVVIMIIGIVGGCISTYSSITDIITNSAFSPPCYINITSAN